MAPSVWNQLGAGVCTAIVAAGLAGAGDARAQTALKGAEIEAALVGKAFRVKTRQVPLGDRDHPSGITTRTDGGYAEIEIFVRSNRSIIFRCTAFARDGSSAPCRGGGYARDVGVWTVEAEHFCY